MTLHSVDAERFDYLVKISFTPAELREFFKSQRSALILAHEKVQNLPSDPIVTIRHFSSRAHAILRSWLATKPLKTPVADDQLVPRFRSVEELGVMFTSEEAVHLAGSALRALYRDPPPAALLEFLRTPRSRKTQPVQRPAELRATATQTDWEILLDACAGNTPLREVVDTQLRTAVSLILAARSGQDVEIPAECEIPRAALLAHLDRKRVATNTGPASGITSRPLEIRAYSQEFDYASAEVIAVRTKTTFKQNVPWFSEAEAFVRGKDIFCLSKDDFRLALPLTGDVVVHRDRGMPEPPLNEPRVYEIELVETAFSSKALATHLIDRLFPVIFMPCASSDAPGIRDFIGSYAKEVSHESAIFVTTDNICLRPHKTSLAKVNLPAHDWMMECWSRLDAYELSTGTYVVAPLPSNPQLLDCGPLAAVAKRVLNHLKAQKLLDLPRTAIAVIAEHLASDSSGLSGLTKERLVNNLRSIESAGDAYQQLIDALLAVPQIANDIAVRTHEAVQRQLAQTAAERQKIENLRRQAAELEASNKKLEERRDSAVKEIRVAVRKAFNAATNKEIAMLGEFSLLTALLPNSPAVAGITTAPGAIETVQLQSPKAKVRVLEKSELTVERILSAFGLESRHLEVTGQALSVLFRAGVFVVFEDAGANELAAQLASASARTRVRIVDVPVGLIESAIDTNWLDANDCDVILFQNANLSDVSVYAPPLISLVARRLIGRAKGTSPTILLSGSGGPAAVPWPSDLDSLGIKITLSSLESVVSRDEEPNESASGQSPIRRLLKRAINRQADQQEVAMDVRRALAHLIADRPNN